jgi:hypothetical protein
VIVGRVSLADLVLENSNAQLLTADDNDMRPVVREVDGFGLLDANFFRHLLEVTDCGSNTYVTIARTAKAESRVVVGQLLGRKAEFNRHGTVQRPRDAVPIRGRHPVSH